MNVIHFADDTTAFIRANNLDKLLTTINNQLNSINTWLLFNRLTLNIEKSFHMVFGPGDVTLNMLHFNINIIKLVKVEKILFFGVIFDNKLSFINHYIEILSKLLRVTGIAYRLRY